MRETLWLDEPAYLDALELLAACWTSRSSVNHDSAVTYIRESLAFDVVRSFRR